MLIKTHGLTEGPECPLGSQSVRLATRLMALGRIRYAIRLLALLRVQIFMAQLKKHTSRMH